MPYWRAYYHLIWATKNRLPCIEESWEPVIVKSLRMTSADLRCKLLAVGQTPDHIHVAINIPPSIAVSEVVRRLKGGSSYAVNRFTDSDTFSWQTRYGMDTFSERSLKSVSDYLLHQKERHSADTLIQRLERIED